MGNRRDNIFQVAHADLITAISYPYGVRMLIEEMVNFGILACEIDTSEVAIGTVPY